MASRIAILICLVVFMFPLVATGQSSLHLTGNSKVDFFGSTSLTSYQPTILIDTTMPSYLDETTTKKEKSPWLAGVLSLVVPGAGEVYSENYIKGALFFAVDVTAWALAYSYDKKGDRQTDEFQAYANQHWSAVQYVNWTLDNISVLTEGQSARSEYEDLVFNSDYDPDEPCRPPFRCVEWNSLHVMEDSIGRFAPTGGNGYTHRLPYYGEQQYYELIGKYNQFSRGWDDADLSPITSSDLPLRSNSQRFFEYANMRAQANRYYDKAGTWVSVAILNHVISALDAYWSTTRYNKALQAEVKMKFYPTPYGLVPVTEARVKYNF